MYLALRCQMRIINSINRGNALAQNRSNPLACTVGTSRQRSCNQRFGCLSAIVGICPTKRSSPMFHFIINQPLIYERITKKIICLEKLPKEYMFSCQEILDLILALNIIFQHFLEKEYLGQSWCINVKGSTVEFYYFYTHLYQSW